MDTCRVTRSATKGLEASHTVAALRAFAMTPVRVSGALSESSSEGC